MVAELQIRIQRRVTTFQMADRRYSGQWKRSFFKVKDTLVQLNMSMRINGHTSVILVAFSDGDLFYNSQVKIIAIIN